jgi:hypothetical protein
MDTALHSTPSLDYVVATLNYLAPTDERPINYMYKVPEGTPQTTRRFQPHQVRIYNGRPLAERLSLDREGFQLVSHQIGDYELYDREAVERLYYPALDTLLKSATGAEKVVIFDATLRSASQEHRERSGLREPVQAVHNDYTLVSGPQRVRELLDPDEAYRRLQNRFAQINVWRPIRGPVAQWPLALCDARTIAPEDLVATEQRYRNRLGEIYSITYNPAHRWFYFPAMRRDEVVLIKGYDSAADGRARFTGHTSFSDPSSPMDAPARESIEVRAYVFFSD